MSDELTPITRKETFLAKAGGQNVVTPTPITREETFLQAIIDASGGGGGTGGGVLVAKMSPDTGALDKTWQEVLDASFCQIIVDSGAEGKTYLPILSIYVDNGYKIDTLLGNGAGVTFTATSASDYPVANMG